MNKDVIYIEPEDDITDIISKIENSAAKIAVLVPPKKAGVLRSVVNMKLIAKAGLASDKNVVLVTVDPSIIKLAAASHILVTKDLKTPPEMPRLDADIDDTETEFTDDEADDEPEEAEEEPDDDASDDEDEDAEDGDEADAEDDDDDEEEPAKPAPKGKFGAFIEWIRDHKVIVALGGLAVVALIAFLIWAFIFAPAVKVNVEIQTWNKNFAENVNFTVKREEENAAEGTFLLGEKKVETIKEMKFNATGKKNVGEHAKGEAVVYTFMRGANTITVNTGTTISVDGLNYVVEKGTELSWDGVTASVCQNDFSSAVARGCEVVGTVTISAAGAGTEYNHQWTDSASGLTIDASGVYAGGGRASGGTDKEATVVEQIDVEKAKDQLKSESEDEIKKKLYETIGDGLVKIESSFSVNIGNAEASPAVGEEVADGVTPTLKIVTTATVLVLDQAKMEEFISAKTAVGDGERIYEIKNPYIENFVKDGETYTGRMKANCNIGPSVSEAEVLEIVQGKGLGDIQHDLKKIGGIVGVNIETSYPWVNVAPSDSNKITINLTVREQNSSTSGSSSATKGDQ